MINIGDTLQSNISNGALQLAATVFPGPIQTAISDYLNGITIPIGSQGSLTVSGSGASLTLNMNPVVFEGTVSADQATLKISGTGEYSDAFISVQFTNTNGSVSILLTATMGQNLQWRISDLWPAELNYDPFNQLFFDKGNLSLTTSGTGDIDFSGSGELTYNGDVLAEGAIRVVNKDGSTGVLLGVVVPNWNAGSVWSELNGLSFEQSGLLFSSIPVADSGTLADLGLIDQSAVPSYVDGKFTVATGLTFFTTLELDGFLQPLENFLGSNEILSLYANRDNTGQITLLAKFTTVNFKPNPNAIFQFNGFQLSWIIGQGSYNITASASGTFFVPDSSQQLTLELSGAIKPQEGDIELELAIEDWQDPFGYEKLEVKNFAVNVILGAEADGVTLGISGDFEFAPDDGDNFQMGVAGEIADFEVPTGIAFLLSADDQNKPVKLGDLVEGITSIDVNSIPVIQTINDFLQVENFDFAVVEGPSLTIGNITFPQGYTLNADFDILQEEEIILNLVVGGQGTSQQFTALADLKQPVKFGSVLTLAGFDVTTKQPILTQGPEIAVSSSGQVIAGVNNGQPVYFYTDGYMQLFDIIQAEIYGLAATSGMFEFYYSVQAGARQGDSGVWAGETISVGLNPKAYAFSAGFSFDFGWQNESIGPVSLFGVPVIPQISLPNFSIAAGIGVSASGDIAGGNVSFLLQGALDFDLFGLSFNFGSPTDMKTLLSINLSDAPQKLSDIKDAIWTWLKNNIEALAEDLLKGLTDFLNWVKAQFRNLGLVAAAVAQVLKNTFDQVAKDIASALKDIGYLASQIYDALVNGIGVAISEAESIVNSLFTSAKDCAMETAAKLGG